MSQIGSFVPAESAVLPVFDRVFTRVGATDFIAKGQSTFLVEMLEAANILRSCSANSLVLLDEIGRGTSTYDGLSIAWAIVEFLHDMQRHAAKTVFATHYHELTELATYLPCVRNFQVAIKERAGNIKFLHQIIPGGCDDSYGIEVAKIAGLPKAVVLRAKEILDTLESGSKPITPSALTIDGKKGKKVNKDGLQISLFDPELHPLVIALNSLDMNKLSPLDAWQLLEIWQKRWAQKNR